MKGYQFLRQRPIGAYIADFMCIKLKLIIEVDGESHTDNEVKDKVRDEKLKLLGFETLRFTDREVADELNLVQEKIEKYISEFELGL
jgi:very-short-patch-repair endonuclease